MRISLFSLCLLLLVVPSPAHGQLSDPVQIQTGLVSGRSATDAGVKAYLGIPFAQAPAGDLRWKPPQPAKSWEGVRIATGMPPACIQNVSGARLPWTEEFMHQGAISEDCLYLNVWTPAASADEQLPVMVYIYGGGFNEGSNAVAVYDGEELAKKGVVLVGINYRVGVLGFFAHPELIEESPHDAAGNYGLLDQVAGLQWVQENIAAFGGDPNQVTIFGQSAGGMSVAMLMQSHLAKGLFAQAIIQSGPGLFSSSAISNGAPLAEAAQNGVAFAELKGASSLAELRALTPETLMAPVEGAPRFGTVSDGYYLTPDNPNRDQVPVMNGFTADDFGTGGGFGPPSEPTVATFIKDARRVYEDAANPYLALYKPDTDAEVPAMRKASGRDRARTSLHLWSTEQQAMSDVIYTYYFDRAIPWPEHPEFGAFHTGEVPYVFNNLKKLSRNWEPVDHTVADQMSSYWVNFAKTGDPNGAGLPAWQPFSPDAASTQQIGARTGKMQIAEPAKVEFWKEQMEE